MNLQFLFTLFNILSLITATYIVTCHNNNECGSVCNKYSSDMIAPTEGLFGTSCKCGSGGSTTHRCNALGYDVRVCSDYTAPSCSTACGQYICIQKDNKKTNGQILSACPKNHPVNTQQCCDHPTSKDYCTCIIQDTLDLNAQPYSALGNTNGYSQSATWGKCGSTLASLNININSTRASNLVVPFLTNGLWCALNESTIKATVPVEQCDNLSYDECGRSNMCSYCKFNLDHNIILNLDHNIIPREKCYEKQEGKVLEHIVRSEIKDSLFVCY